MIVSRANPFTGVSAAAKSCVVVIVFMLAHGTAWGQEADNAPIRLTPPKPEAAEPPSDTTRPTEGLLKPPSSSVSSIKPTALSVQIDTLGTVDPDTAGVLAEQDGGFGIDLWRGLTRARVMSLLQRLPVQTESPAMRDLMRRLLLSVAAVPQSRFISETDSGAENATEKAKSGSLVALRVKLLRDMGDLAGVKELLTVIPGRSENESLMRISSDALFLANDNARACSLVAGQLGVSEDEYWQKAFIFCQALGGQSGKAALGLDLLREMGNDDLVYNALIDALIAGETPVIETFSNPQPMNLAIARAARASLPIDVISTSRPGVLRAIAVSPNAEVALRLEAAERAQSMGTFSVEDLRQLYSSVSFSDKELSTSLSRTEVEGGPASRALLYRTAVVQTVPVAQAEAVARALALGREGGRYASAVGVFVDVIKVIPAVDEVAWFAPDAIRAFLLIGDLESASPWFTLLRASAMFDKKSKAALDALLPLVRLAGSEQASEWSGDSLRLWWDIVKDGDDSRNRAALIYSLLDVMGEQIPGHLWAALLDGPDRSTAVMPHPALWFQLDAAARDGRIGETVMLALLALGPGGAVRAEPLTLHRVVGALITVGFEAEARSISIEAVLGAGL